MNNDKSVWRKVSVNLEQNNNNHFQKTISPRWGHANTQIGNYILYFAGYADSTYMNDLWSFDIINMIWKKQHLEGNYPECRSNCTMNIDVTTDKIVVFGGGGNNKNRFNDVHYLNWNQKKWEQPSIQNYIVSPPPRTYHTSQLYNGFLITFGGQCTKDLDDIWALQLQSGEWKQLNPSGQKPKQRRFHASSLIQSKMYIVGGCYDKYYCLNDIFQIDLSPLNNHKLQARLVWNQIKIENRALITRWGHSCNSFQNKLYIFGGRFSSDLNDLLIIDPKKGKMTQIYCKQKQPVPRRRHCASFSGSSLIIFGGFNGTYFNDLYYYNVTQVKIAPSSSNFVNDRMKLMEQEGDKQIGQWKAHSMIIDQILKKVPTQTPTYQLKLFLYTGQVYGSLQSLILSNPSVQFVPLLQTFIPRKQASIRIYQQLTSHLKEQQKPYKNNKQFQKFNNQKILISEGYQLNQVYKRYQDVQFIVNGQRVWANKNLIKRCEYFANLFYLEDKTVYKIDFIPIKYFKVLLNYLYFYAIILPSQLEREEYMQLIQLGQYVQLGSFKELLQSKMSQKINLQNLEQTYQWSMSRQNLQIRKYCCLYLANWYQFNDQQSVQQQERHSYIRVHCIRYLVLILYKEFMVPLCSNKHKIILKVNRQIKQLTKLNQIIIKLYICIWKREQKYIIIKWMTICLKVISLDKKNYLLLGKLSLSKQSQRLAQKTLKKEKILLKLITAMSNLLTNSPISCRKWQ